MQLCGGRITRAFKRRRYVGLQLFKRHHREMLPVHPLQLLRVEHRRLFLKAASVETLDQLRDRHYFRVVASRPSEQREEVEHRARQQPLVLIVANSRGAVAL